jgi:glycosyltransferase involved in cell wall biosynthesis
MSVVVPAFNEEENILPLYRRITTVVGSLCGDYEIILVDDGSTDGTLAAIKNLAGADPRVKYISFSRNFGHEAASTAGLDTAKGEITILIDADLQDPPELIPELMDKWSEGYDVVYAVRRSRDKESFLKKTTSHLFYKVINALSKPPLPVDTGDFRLIDRKALDALRRCREVSRFVRGLSTWVGFRQAGVPYDRQSRSGGETKYNYLRLTLLAIEAISSFSLAPLRLSLILGTIGFFFGAVMSIVVFFQKLLWDIPVSGYTFQMLTILLFGSINFFLLGIIAEYVGKVFLETQKRPLYIVRETSPGLMRVEQDG